MAKRKARRRALRAQGYERIGDTARFDPVASRILRKLVLDLKAPVERINHSRTTEWWALPEDIKAAQALLASITAPGRQQHRYMSGEPTCVDCGAFGPTQDDEPCVRRVL